MLSLRKYSLLFAFVALAFVGLSVMLVRAGNASVSDLLANATGRELVSAFGGTAAVAAVASVWLWIVAPRTMRPPVGLVVMCVLAGCFLLAFKLLVPFALLAAPTLPLAFELRGSGA